MVWVWYPSFNCSYILSKYCYCSNIEDILKMSMNKQKTIIILSATVAILIYLNKIAILPSTLDELPIHGHSPLDGSAVHGHSSLDGTEVHGHSPLDGTQVDGHSILDGSQVDGHSPLDGSSVHGHSPLDGPHSILDGTQVDGHSACLMSVEECLDLISIKSGKHPKLVSHSKQQPTYNHHPVTGEQIVVPNIVHVVRFGQNYAYEFQNYVSLKSIDKFIKPHLLLIWGDYLPMNTSVWWKRTVQEVANIYFVPRDRIPTIHGKPVMFPAHESDWLRMEVIRG